MKPSLISTYLVLLLICFSCKIQENITPVIEIEGTWEQETKTTNGTETLVFVFNEDKSFTSYTETCVNANCNTEPGQDATWSLNDETITLSYLSINLTRTYTITKRTDTVLELEYGTNALIFSKN